MDRNNNRANPPVPSFLAWLYPYKVKKLPLPTKSPAAYYIFQNKIFLTIVNWIFQGMRNMDKADLAGKIMLDILFSVLFAFIIRGDLIFKITVSLLLAHTINWMFNTHFWVFGRFLGITRTPPDRFFPFIRNVLSRVRNDSSVPIVIVIGSISRAQEFKVTSDVDMMFIRRPGLQNAVKAILVTMRERVYAFIGKFPLHLELYDSIESMKKHRMDEEPFLLKDVENVARNWYEKAGMTINASGELTEI
jgi:hypothetical protein